MVMGNTLVKEALSCSITMHHKNTYSWASYIQNILDSSNLNLKVDDPNYVPDKGSIADINSILKNHYCEIDFNALSSDTGRRPGQGNKLRTYATFKETHTLEPYLHQVSSFNNRRDITKLRLSAHKLEIESGRHHNIPSDLRFCPHCPDKVGDEKHFIISCSKLTNERSSLFEVCKDNIENFLNVDPDNQFIEIMKASTKPVALALGCYCSAGFAKLGLSNKKVAR